MNQRWDRNEDTIFIQLIHTTHNYSIYQLTWFCNKCWCTSINCTINSTLTPSNIEKSLRTPGSSPRVCANPIVQATLISPSNNLHCMSTFIVTSGMLINSTLIVHEVRIDVKLSLYWPICLNFCLNCKRCLCSDHWIRDALVLQPCSSSGTFCRTSVYISLTWCIRYTCISYNSIIYQIAPCIIEVTTRAGIVSSITWYHILWRKYNISLSCRFNGKPIT